MSSHMHNLQNDLGGLSDRKASTTSCSDRRPMFSLGVDAIRGQPHLQKSFWTDGNSDTNHLHA